MVNYLYPLSFLDNPSLSHYYTNIFLDDAYRERIRLQLLRKLKLKDANCDTKLLYSEQVGLSIFLPIILVESDRKDEWGKRLIGRLVNS